MQYEILTNACRRTVRRLRRAPGFVTAVVASLALGVGANTAVFSLVRQTLLRPLSYPDPDQLVTVGTAHKDGVSWHTSEYNVAAWEARSRTLGTVSGMSWVRFLPSLGIAGAERLNGAKAGSALLNVLGARPLLGRWFTADEERRLDPVVVLSYSRWRQTFGADTGVVGTGTIRVENRVLTIIGVLPPGIGYPANADFWYPDPGGLFVEVVARLKPGVTPGDARRELSSIAPGVEKGRKLGISIDFVVVTLHDRLYGSNGPILRLLFWSTVLLLVLACLNVANLILARALERSRERALAIALGASRGNLVADVIVENGILGALSGVAGLVLATWATHLLVRFRPTELVGFNGTDITTVVVALGAAAAATLLVSIAPITAVARGDVRSLIGHAGSAGGAGRATARLRKTLVVAQLVTALVLTSASGLLIRSMVRLIGIDTGFDRRQLVVSRVQFFRGAYGTDPLRREVVNALASKVRALPGVRSVAIGPPPLVGGHGPGLSEGYDNVFSVRDSTLPGAPSISVWVKYVSAGYLQTFGIPILRGRGIEAGDDDSSAPAVALLNTRAERLFFRDGHAVGQLLRGLPAYTAERTSGGRPITVVGVVPDVRQRDITLTASPEVFLPLAQQNVGAIAYVSAKTTGSAEATARTIRSVIAALDPNLPRWRVSTMDEIVRTTLAPQRYVLTAVTSFAIVALTLAGVGLYAVVSYFTIVRTREFGVRIALGATTGQVLLIVLRSALGLATIGVAIGLPLARVFSTVMRRYLYETGPDDASALTGAAITLWLIALFAAYVPARRATTVDPVQALRAD